MPEKETASPEKTAKPTQEKPETAASLAREEKLAAALRANLKRRKQAARKVKES